METYVVQIDCEKPYRQSANMLSEILDDAEPKYTRSTCIIYRELGLRRAGGVGGWVMTHGPAMRYEWDPLDSEWSRNEGALCQKP